MTVLGRPIQVLAIVFLIAVLSPSDAYAYLDPGTGSLLVQSLVATLAAVGYGVRLNWGRIRDWLRRAPAPASGSTVPRNANDSSRDRPA